MAFNKDALTRKQVENFQKGMLNANQSAKGKEMMKWCGMTSFESIPDDYETLLANVLKNYPAIAPQTVQVKQTEDAKGGEGVKEK